MEGKRDWPAGKFVTIEAKDALNDVARQQQWFSFGP